MLRSRVAVPVVALYTAWQAAGLPQLHRALIAQIDFDEDQLAEGDLSGLNALARNSWGALEQLGLARGGQIHPDLASTLRLIAEATTEYYAFFSHEDSQTCTALTVRNGDEAVRVVLTPDNTFVLEPIRPEDAAQALIAALPPTPPGKGGPISLPGDALEAKPQRYEDTGSFMQQSRPTSTPHDQQVQQLRKIMSEQRTGGGQLYAAWRDSRGRKQRCENPLTFFDTISGRYITQKTSGWLNVMPGDFTTLARLTAELPA
ncbi:ESX secretion-associated protein EspG [Lentzea tibetensis]|uniref:ESX secretion-associated protein EspG n=1 Tax=Lentzea tibetensis TaxID=2591470 RepID=UPI001648D8AE|nr:ESX secretion-associated protein EspG [Lentzea tibetensis]